MSERSPEGEVKGPTPRDLVEGAFRVAREDPAEAEDRLRRAVARAPHDPMVRWALGRFLHDGRSDVGGARAEYDAALALDPAHAPSLRDSARLAHYLALDLDLAESLYRRAVAAQPERAQPRLDLAAFLETMRRDLDGAEVEYRAALAATPDAPGDAEVAWARFLHHGRRDRSTADAAYRAALAARPSDADLHAWYAVFLRTLGQDPDRADGPFETALVLAPEHGFALSNFALHLWSHRGDVVGAARRFEDALAAEPDRWSTHWWYAAFLHEALNDRARAAAHYRRAVTLEPRNPALLRQYQLFLEGSPRTDEQPTPARASGRRPVDDLFDQGALHERRGDRDRAEDCYRAALRRDPDHGPTLRRYGRFLQLAGRLDEAEVQLLRAVEVAPDDGWAHGFLARFWATHRGDVVKADRHYRRAIAAGLHDPKWLGEYARFLEEVAGDPERAAVYYRRALSNDPAPEVAVDYARFLSRHASPTEAEQAFRRAIELAPGDDYPLRQYAHFLEVRQGDLDAAESLYLRAVTTAPRSARCLGEYARFLDRRRGDDLRAAHYYLRAARLEPGAADSWAAVVRFCVRRGLVDEALGSLRRWRSAADRQSDAEAAFYGVVYLPRAERVRAYDDLRRRLASADPVSRFDPQPHLDRVAGRPDHRWVERLATVLVDRMRAAT